MEPFAYIVGRNGSGKSNFFAAVRFVLHDAYTKLGQEERQALLHEGGSHPSHMAAYVEIILDNSELRFPTGKEETVIRRTVGLKKDEYSVDGRPSNKTDVLNLLQTAGFSRSNPYYIVPQGRVTALTIAKDSERLELLKEVAGTRVYEEHRQESLRIMADTTAKRTRIAELLRFIEERLVELEEERAELREYQERDRKRRTIEYILHQRQLVETSSSLERLEGENGELAEENARSVALFEEQLGRIHEMESSLVELRRQLGETEEELAALQQDREALLKSETALQLALGGLDEQMTLFAGEESTARLAADKIAAKIASKEAQLFELRPRLERSREELDRTEAHALQAEGRREALLAKQGRAAQFRSAADRDRWIRKEIQAMEATRAVQARQVVSIDEELETERAKADHLQQTIARLSAREANLCNDLSSLDEQLCDLRTRRDAVAENRKELWRAENKLESSIAVLSEEAQRTERTLMSTMDRAVLQGLEAVRRIAREQNMQGVYGALYELFQVEEVFRCATEVVAGTSLFDVVVEDEQVASRLLEILVREKLGRVTLMPLNRLRPSNPTSDYPSREEGGEMIPLIEKLRFEERFAPAMRQVFGKTIICRDLAAGSALVRGRGLDAVTLSGDRANRRGALTGGYLDVRQGRLATIFRLRQAKDKLAEHLNLLDQVRVKLRQAEQEATRTLAEMQHLECRRNQLQEGDGGASELEARSKELSSLQTIIATKERLRQDLQGEMSALASQMESLGRESGTPLNPQLTFAESAELSSVTTIAEQARQQMQRMAAEVTQLEAEYGTIENELDLNLRRRRQELTRQLARLSTETLQRRREMMAQELEALHTLGEHKTATVQQLMETQQHLNNEIHNTSSGLDKARLVYEEERRTINRKDQSATMEKYLARRMALAERRDACQRKIRELAYVPDATFEELREVPEGLLMRMLHELHEEVRTRYAHVNKKAHEQHAAFCKQGEQLRQRHGELEEAARAIDEFITVLDRRKDEAIDRTFQQVARGFSEMFERLVPSGRGELVMLRNLGGEVENGDSDRSKMVDGPRELTTIYEGVSIRVSFNGRGDGEGEGEEEGLLMGQLSGGQKSLVALALVFAIQRCDPAPFYLFDEIDANLDAAHRAAVARLIHELAYSTQNNAQFITTTFRPEMLEQADGFFGVSFGGRVSRVERISREQALEFVEERR